MAYMEFNYPEHMAMTLTPLNIMNAHLRELRRAATSHNTPHHAVPPDHCFINDGRD